MKRNVESTLLEFQSTPTIIDNATYSKTLTLVRYLATYSGENGIFLNSIPDCLSNLVAYSWL